MYVSANMFNLLFKEMSTKKILLPLFLMLLPFMASADTVEIDGVCYNLIEKAKTAEVTKKTSGEYSGEIVIPAKVTYKNIEYTVSSIGNDAFVVCKGLTSVSIPNSVTSIGNSAFNLCKGLTSISIPSSVTSISGSAFMGCSNLNAVHIKDLSAWCKITFGDINSNPLTSAHHLYVNGEKIKKLIIPKDITELKKYAFANATDITTIEISDNIVSIGHYAFIGCSGLSSITFPKSVTTIGEYAFWECALNSVTIPNNVTSIGNWAFGNCYNLTTVNILSSIVTIGNKAFMNCQKLIDVYCYAKKISNNFWSKTGLWTAPDAFLDSYPESITLHVPLASINDYKATEPWKYFKSIVALDGETTQEKCATPKISYTNGKLKFDCETEGVEFVSEITDKDIKKNYTSEVALTATYNITVYASKSGYDDSETAKATLCWIDTNPKTEGIINGVANVRAMPVMIQSQGGVLNITGAPEGSVINVYDLSGKMVDSAISGSDSTVIPTNLKSGEIGIIKIADKSIKVLMR